MLSAEVEETEVNATKNAKRLYQSCMNEELLHKHGEQRFLSLLEYDMDGWPLIGKESKTNATLLEKLIRVRLMGFKPLIDLHVTLNPKDPQYLILKVLLFNRIKHQFISLMVPR